MKLEELGVKSDDRGDLVEAYHLPNDGVVFYLNIKPLETRGNHYHMRKTEHFLVIAGEATISAKDRMKGNVMNVVVTGNAPMKVTITPNSTHNIKAGKGGCICLVWCDEILNEQDSDTYPEEI